MTAIPGDRDVWFAFSEDRFRRQGHHGKWWGKLLRTWKTGADEEKTKACFRLSDGQDVTLILEDEEYMDTPEQHAGYCDPEDLCDGELRHLGLDELVQGGRGGRARKAGKVASNVRTPAATSKKRKAPDGPIESTRPPQEMPQPGGHLVRPEGCRVRKTRGTVTPDDNHPSRTVQGGFPGLPRVTQGEEGTDNTSQDPSDAESELNIPPAEPATPPAQAQGEATIVALPDGAPQDPVPEVTAQAATPPREQQEQTDAPVPPVHPERAHAPGLVELPQSPREGLGQAAGGNTPSGDDEGQGTVATPEAVARIAMNFLNSPPVSDAPPSAGSTLPDFRMPKSQ